MGSAPLHRRFILNRLEDASGVSGTGIVAEGVEFSDGTAVLHWTVGGHPCSSTWNCTSDIEFVHGHEGRTKVEWVDG